MVKLLTVDLLLESKKPTDGEAIKVKLNEILKALRNIAQPERKLDKFPWKKSLRVSHTYSYPPFMYISLRTRQASIVQDREQIDKRIEKIKQNSSNKLVTDLLSDPSNFFPNQWSADRLKPVNHGRGQICVSDFPFKGQLDPNEVSSLLGASV
jgi:hypothetical protein